MIRMIQSRASAHAKAYFNDALSKSDYYVSDQELPGIWQGRLASRLGLEGKTSQEAFFALCDNLHPLTGEHLTPQTKDNRTVGYDINFHCPKSVSIMHALSKDDKILVVFRDSVTQTMQDIEADMKTRVRKDEVYDDRDTRELAWGHFVHQTARPVEGYLPDPHLHSHCFVFNATWDEEEQRIKAGQFRDIKRDMPYYQAAFHKRLADNLAGLGYAIRKTDKSFEIEGVPQNVINLFSKRTDEIGRIAKEKGITEAKELDKLGARTRAKKQKGVSMEELAETWRKQILTLDVSEEEAKAHVLNAPQKENNLTAEQCMDYAILHCFERASVMQGRRILAEAYKRGISCNTYSVADLRKTFEADGRIIQVKDGKQTMCTTKDVLWEEKRMVDLARKGKGQLSPAYHTAPELALDGQQGAAVAHVLTTQDRVSIVRGAAGTGKTTLMKEAFKHFQEAGKEVMVVAPTAQASRGVLRQEGFGEAETVASLLVNKQMQERLKGQVLWVDEAGLLGTRDMAALLDIATKQDAQLILGGDTRQHASVVRGDALRVLNTVAGIRSAEVSKIYRQQNAEYRAAVQDLSQGEVKAGFEKLDALGFIKDMDGGNPTAMIVEDYMAALKNGKSVLVVSPTHAQGNEVTAEIRKRMRDEGLIGEKEISIPQLINLNKTQAEKSYGWNLEAGQFIQFSQNAPGFKRGSVWKILSASDKEVQVKNDEGETQLLPTNRSGSYDVFVEEKISLSKGDRIRITRNGFDGQGKRLDNGDMLEVLSVSAQGDIHLQNERSKSEFILPQNHMHLAHACCVTSYSSQGKTVDEVFIYQPAATFLATDAKQFYVSVSRGKERAHIYTDDKEDLLHYASDLGHRPSALELLGKHKAHKDYVEQNLRMEKTEQEHPKNKTEYEPDI